MRFQRLFVAGILLTAIPALAHASQAPGIRGQYVEFRNADVYTGPCFANAEVGLAGQDAILAWHVDGGAWTGASLGGLNVVAVVRASATLGDPFADPLPARTVFLVDSRASRQQRDALIRFAQAQAAGLLNDVVAVQAMPVSFTTAQHGWTTLQAGNVLKLSTRTLGASDVLCHNEEVYYPPLASNLRHAMPVVAQESAYQGHGLGVTWDDYGRRSSFVGAFSE